MPAAHYPRPYKVLRHITAACGWLLYGYEWIHVSWQTPRGEAITFGVLLICSALLIHATVSAWVAHNRRLAAKGTRGRVTRYTVPSFARDYLGRELVLHEASRLSQEVIVQVDGNTKYYLAATLVHESSRRRQNIIVGPDDGTKLPVPVPELV